MTRIASRPAPPLTVALVIDLLLGPSQFAEEELLAAWRAYGHRFRDEIGPPNDRGPCWAARQFGRAGN